MGLTATRVGVLARIGSEEYLCSRCGIRRSFKGGEPRPELCRDCLYVLGYDGSNEPDEPRDWTVDEIRVAHAAYVRGLRDTDTLEGQREYDRRRRRDMRARFTPEKKAAETARLAELKRTTTARRKGESR